MLPELQPFPGRVLGAHTRKKKERKKKSKITIESKTLFKMLYCADGSCKMWEFLTLSSKSLFAPPGRNVVQQVFLSADCSVCVEWRVVKLRIVP